MIHAEHKDGLYVVKNISRKYRGKAFITCTLKATAMPARVRSDDEESSGSEADIDESEAEKPATKEERHIYRLLHRRFCHYGPNLIKHLHEVTNLKEKIKIPPKEKRFCHACAIGKFKNLINKELVKYRLKTLGLISINIVGLFPTSLRGNR